MDAILQAALAAIGSFFVVTIIFLVILGLCKGVKKQDPQSRARTVPNSDLSSIAISESASFDRSLHRISMCELVKATRDFSSDLIIGDGSFGLVYKARLTSGATVATVAVKKLSSDAFQGFREFRAEMETLGKLRHPNIVRILGYCATGSDRLLILEFIEKGSLDQWLLDTSSSNNNVSTPILPLSWETRLKIVRGVANGLNYMHNLDKPIIHRDIKASNVLLDSEFEPHIADFGLARRIEGTSAHVSTQVAGTMGYMPPEYINGATMATTVGDVYSFGILMLEIATGIRPNLPFKVEEEGGCKEVRLAEWARKMAEKNQQMKMLDANISRDGLNRDGVVEFFKIATSCSSEECKLRPSMKEVMESLNRIPT
ncbi:Leucine-rich repeat receptor protein kinase EMS1 [Camellia lanceoleosa]|uniref:Leucine-rich repeat receptor protein kinase EMS1 n=1 Tax=Camellia lanceoleosa TaxID=1840588 RepID=A0ACC0GTQ7_9ERIC|nr:Leucine-rich repeat receptor protein kinase EMS1 [Camellia lanceoleosa]